MAAKFGSLDYLINNAGYFGSEQRYYALDEPLEQIEAIFKTNVLGPLNVTRAFYPLLLKGTNKTIVNISSGAGSVSWHVEAVAAPEVQLMQSVSLGYKISKAALNMQVSFHPASNNSSILSSGLSLESRWKGFAGC